MSIALGKEVSIGAGTTRRPINYFSGGEEGAPAAAGGIIFIIHFSFLIMSHSLAPRHIVAVITCAQLLYILLSTKCKMWHNVRRNLRKWVLWEGGGKHPLAELVGGLVMSCTILQWHSLTYGWLDDSEIFKLSERQFLETFNLHSFQVICLVAFWDKVCVA